MSLVLTKRASNGAPLTANQFDANMTAIESAVNTNTTAISTGLATKISVSDLNGYFSGTSGGKQLVDWANLLNIPVNNSPRYAFNAYRSGADQTISASGTLNIGLDSKRFDINSVFDTTNSWFLAPRSGYYHLNMSVQVQLVSGSPSAVSIIAYVKGHGGSHIMASTLDNTGTGVRIYRASEIVQLTAGDQVSVSCDFSFTGTATWSTSGGGAYTSLNGYLVDA